MGRPGDVFPFAIPAYAKVRRPDRRVRTGVGERSSQRDRTYVTQGAPHRAGWKCSMPKSSVGGP
jgi:hypothetical protein